MENGHDFQRFAEYLRIYMVSNIKNYMIRKKIQAFAKCQKLNIVKQLLETTAVSREHSCAFKSCKPTCTCLSM